jgi:hypothetical protein
MMRKTFQRITLSDIPTQIRILHNITTVLKNACFLQEDKYRAAASLYMIDGGAARAISLKSRTVTDKLLWLNCYGHRQTVSYSRLARHMNYFCAPIIGTIYLIVGGAARAISLTVKSRTVTDKLLWLNCYGHRQTVSYSRLARRLMNYFCAPIIGTIYLIVGGAVRAISLKSLFSAEISQCRFQHL